MAYQVLALKWRPALFEQVVAQEHVTRTLQNAISGGRVANAYLFSGPRGVGKTTTARIFAKALNCEKGPTPTPCNVCTHCVEIAAGRSMDVMEIDGASNRGIDEIRNLRENIRYAPASSRYKIYIVDEVHMLTTEAFNALLKTLEEPPEHVVFIFATTEPHKVPATILSRCQRFDFKRIPIQVIMNQLQVICEEEKITIGEDALRLIAKKADGSMRDAQSILDQMISFAGNEVSLDDVLKSLGIIHQDLYFEFTDLLKSGNVHKAMEFVDRFIVQGLDISGFLIGLIEHFRNKLFVLASKSDKLLDVSAAYKERYLKELGDFSEEDLLRYIEVVSQTEVTIRRSPNPRIRLEMMVVKLIKMGRSVTIGELVERLKKIESRPSRLVLEEKPKKKAGSPDLFKMAAPKKTPPKTSPPSVPRQSPSVSEPASPSAESPASAAPAPPPEEEEPPSPFVGEPDSDYEASPSVNLQEIQVQWPKILQEVKKKKLVLGVFLQEGTPFALKGNVLEIQFPPGNGFHLQAVQKERNLVRQVIGHVAGARLTLKFSTGETAKDVPPDGATETPPSAPRTNGIDPRVKKILQMFDGELL